MLRSKAEHTDRQHNCVILILKGQINLEFVPPTNRYTKRAFADIIPPYKTIRWFNIPPPRQAILLRYNTDKPQTPKNGSKKQIPWSRDWLPQRRHHIGRPVRLCLVSLKALVRDAIVRHELADSVVNGGAPGEDADHGHVADGAGRWSG